MTSRLIAALRWVAARRPRLGRRGTVAVMFGVSALPIAIATGIGIDFSRLIDARSALQRAADNAALSGASAYVLYTQGDAYNALARSVATSAFCNATSTLPTSFIMYVGASACATQNGPTVTAVIAGHTTGTRGIAASSGCTSTNTVVAGATCGFVVTVSAAATMNSIFPGLFGASKTVSVSASAINPFINIAQALSPTLSYSAVYANSVWVYPLLLDANGSPAFSASNPAALPPTTACTGSPSQTSCGSYTMLASTNYSNCTTANPCTVGTTIFGGAAGSGGIVLNPASGAAVITATTPLGIAMASSPGGISSNGLTSSQAKCGPTIPCNVSFGYARPQYDVFNPSPPEATKFANGCTAPFFMRYNYPTQVYDLTNSPVEPWSVITHWTYSSYLTNNYPPDQGELSVQSAGQAIPPVQFVYNGTATPANPPGCPNQAPNITTTPTTLPSSGSTNCSLIVAKDPATLIPLGSGTCYTPANTPGQAYATISCQGFAGHQFVFFWNDMGGFVNYGDDYDYNDATVTLSCVGQPQVQLIN